MSVETDIKNKLQEILKSEGGYHQMATNAHLLYLRLPESEREILYTYALQELVSHVIKDRFEGKIKARILDV